MNDQFVDDRIEIVKNTKNQGGAAPPYLRTFFGARPFWSAPSIFKSKGRTLVRACVDFQNEKSIWGRTSDKILNFEMGHWIFALIVVQCTMNISISSNSRTSKKFRLRRLSISAF